MDPITREGKKPPMVSVQQSLYYCLKPMDKRKNVINLLGNFVPLNKDCELGELLRQAGIEKINQISACRNFEEYLEMSRARLNLVIKPQAQAAAADLKKRLDMTYHQLPHLYELDGIKEQYRLLGKELDTELDDNFYYAEAAEVLESFRIKHGGLSFAVGQTINGNAFELSVALIKYGFAVPVIFTHIICDEDRPYIEALFSLSPDTRVYSSVNPAMLNFDCNMEEVDVALGLDAGYYFSQAVSVAWNMEQQPFGYRGLIALLKQIEIDLKHPRSYREQMHVSYLVI
jgi:nitrogenase molybdenum-cofactor synthesis protein NifE